MSNLSIRSFARNVRKPDSSVRLPKPKFSKCDDLSCLFPGQLLIRRLLITIYRQEAWATAIVASFRRYIPGYEPRKQGAFRPFLSVFYPVLKVLRFNHPMGQDGKGKTCLSILTVQVIGA